MAQGCTHLDEGTIIFILCTVPIVTFDGVIRMSITVLFMPCIVAVFVVQYMHMQDFRLLSIWTASTLIVN